jgi:hypothetical protein
MVIEAAAFSNRIAKVRLVLDDWNARGFGAPSDYVVAHSWFTLAEVAGSAEAKVRKKQLRQNESRRNPRWKYEDDSLAKPPLGGCASRC